MANTFSQMYLQFVFAVKYRQSLIHSENKEELHKYITGLVQKRKAKMLAIHCMPDHIHLFTGFKPTIYIPDFVNAIKVASNEFINDKKWIRTKFHWQEGYGVFSYSHSHIDNVIKYILNQEEHHKRKHLKRNTINCWISSRFHMKRNICSIFLTRIGRHLHNHLTNTILKYKAP